MHEKPICRLLYESLEAAFKGRDFQGPAEIGAWGETVWQTLITLYPEYSGQKSLILKTAAKAIGSIMHSDDWDRLIIGALCHPQGFLHNLLLMMKNTPTHTAENRAGAPALH